MARRAPALRAGSEAPGYWPQGSGSQTAGRTLDVGRGGARLGRGRAPTAHRGDQGGQSSETNGRRQRSVRAAFTIEDLFHALWQLPKYGGKAATGDRPGTARKRAVLAERTLRDYRQKAESLVTFDPELAGSDITALTKPILVGLYEALWHAKGHHMANGVMTVLRLALSEATRRGWGGLTVNPALGLGLETPPARLRVGTFAEMRALIAAADAIASRWWGTRSCLG